MRESVNPVPGYPELHMIIDGQKIPVAHRRTHTVVNPATGAALGALPLADAADLDRALDAAQRGCCASARRRSRTTQRSKRARPSPRRASKS